MEAFLETQERGLHEVMTRKIGVVTVTYNSGKVLSDFLQSLNQQTVHDFLLIAVDNASSDDTLEQLRAAGNPGMRLIANTQNVGVAAANNQGIRVALEEGCEYVLLLNNDVVFGPDLFVELLTGMHQESCDLVTPLIYFNDEPTRIWAAGGEFQPLLGYRTYHKGENELDRGQFRLPCRIRYAPTCCVLIRAKVFQQIGLMDERYFVYSDDVDFMYRALRAGLPMFLIPEAKLWHKVNSLTGGAESDFALFYGTRGRTLFLCKHLGRLYGTLWTWVYLAFYCWRALIGQDTRHRGEVRLKGARAGREIGLKKIDELTV